MMRKLQVCLVAVLLFAVSFDAASQVILNTGKIKLAVSPGETVTGFLTLRNTSSTPVMLRAYFEDFMYIPPFDASKKFLAMGATKSSCGKWVRFSPQDFTVEPFSKRKINYSINVPPDAKGGYYGVLFFEKSPESSKVPGGLQIITRIGCLFFVETHDKTKAAAIDDIEITANNIQGRFVNSGNVIIISDAVFYIMSREGMIADRGKIKKFYLPPGEKYFFTINLPENLSPGSYTVVLTFDLEEGDVLVREIDFTKDTLGNIRIEAVRE